MIAWMNGWMSCRGRRSDGAIETEQNHREEMYLRVVVEAGGAIELLKQELITVPLHGAHGCRGSRSDGAIETR